VESFEGKVAVVTGGGTGMGRELVIQLATEGCSVATCDLNPDSMAMTVKLAEEAAPPGTKVTAHTCNVADAAEVARFRDEVVEQHETDHVNLVFNNAGIAGGGSFLNAPQEEWDRTFGVCWGGVYNCSRAFVPLLVASDDGYLVNTSSVNGFWAAIMKGTPHTAYSSAKFAVKGFSEALLEDFRVNAPHVKVAVVMPGHIGTDIVLNPRRVHGGGEPEDMSATEIAQTRSQIAARGYPSDSLDDAAVKGLVRMMGEGFRDGAPMTAAQAATVILDGVKAGEWRILVGEDAKRLDERVRSDPWSVYGEDGIELTSLGGTA
jgi:NAD(P)-dependent dehydrogenase (short-subunit alcohol dehydrogenase family)